MKIMCLLQARQYTKSSLQRARKQKNLVSSLKELLGSCGKQPHTHSGYSRTGQAVSQGLTEYSVMAPRIPLLLEKTSFKTMDRIFYCVLRHRHIGVEQL